MNQFAKLKKQKKQFSQMMQLQEKMQHISAEGISGQGLVRVTINGDKELTSIKIDPSCVDKDDVEGLEDLIIDATKKAHVALEEQLKKVAGNYQLPF